VFRHRRWRNSGQQDPFAQRSVTGAACCRSARRGDLAAPGGQAVRTAAGGTPIFVADARDLRLHLRFEGQYAATVIDDHSRDLPSAHPAPSDSSQAAEEKPDMLTDGRGVAGAKSLTQRRAEIPVEPRGKAEWLRVARIAPAPVRTSPPRETMPATPWRGDDTKKLEAVGIEPTSRSTSETASTCVVDRLISTRRPLIDWLPSRPTRLFSHQYAAEQRATGQPASHRLPAQQASAD